MLQFTKFATASALGLLLLTAAGCGKPDTDPAVIAAHQTRLTLSDEPDGVQTVADVRAMLLGDHDDDDADHDHDGDGHPDHDTEDHDAHDDHDHADHDAHDHDGGGHADHDAKDHDTHGDHDHAHADHSDHDHGDHAEPAHETETKEVTVVGHIGGGLTNPWPTMNEYPLATSEAILFLADPEAVIDNEASGHKHAPGEECVFCAQNAPSNTDKLAVVQFVDAKGDVLKIGTQKLFDVKEDDMVVIQGQAKVTARGTLVINATGLYLRN